MTFISKYDCYI